MIAGSVAVSAALSAIHMLTLALGLGAVFARVFLGDKDPAFYWRNGFFWIKMALFGLVFVLEMRPMVTFMQARSARRRGTTAPAFPVATYRRINSAELVLVVAIVFSAAFMARGAWMF